MRKIFYLLIILVLISTMLFGEDKKAESYFHFLKYSEYLGKYQKKSDRKYLEKALNEITKAYEYNKKEPYLFIAKMGTEIILFNSIDALMGILEEVNNYQKEHPKLNDIHKIKALVYDKLSGLEKDSKKKEFYFSKSIAEKEKYLKVVKVYPPFNMDVGMYYVKKNDYKKALKFFEPLAEKKSNEGIYATLFLADVYNRMGNFKKSLEMINWYTSFFGDSPDLCRLKIKNFINLKEYQKADECFSKLLKISQDKVTDKLEYADFLIKNLKNCKKGLEILDSIKNKVKKSSFKYEKFLNLEFLANDCIGKKVEALKYLKDLGDTESNYQWASKYANYCYQLGNYSESINVNLSIFNSLKDKKDKSLLFSYITDQLTYLLFISNHYEDIFKLLKGIDILKIKQFPFDIYLEAFLYLRKYDDLDNFIKKASKIVKDKNVLDFLKFYGYISSYFKTKKYVSWKDFDNFLERFKTFKIGQKVFLANTYYRFIDKRNEFLKYLKKHKKSIDRKTYLGLEAGVFLDMKNYGSLKKVAYEIEKLKPENSSDYNNFGYILIESGVNVVRGIKYVKKALEEKPFNPLFLDSLSWGYYKEGKYKEAYEEFQKAINYGSNAPEVYEHGGDIAYKLKLYSDALKFYKMALNLSYFKNVKDRIEKKIKKIKKPVLLKK